MERIEYKECRITITPAQLEAGYWGARYRVTSDRVGAPIAGVLEGEALTPHEAALRASRIVKVAIDESMPLNGEQFSASLRGLNERFAL